jgi:hypothetical protein
MSITKSGNRVHDGACNLSEMTRQSAVAAAIGNAATIKTLEIDYYKPVSPARLRTTARRAPSFERCRIWARAAYEIELHRISGYPVSNGRDLGRRSLKSLGRSTT